MSEKTTTETKSETEVTTVGKNTRCTVLSRFRSWAVWVSILGAVGIILGSTGVLEKWGLDENGWDNIVTAIGSLLVGFGILNNPTDRKKF